MLRGYFFHLSGLTPSRHPLQIEITQIFYFVTINRKSVNSNGEYMFNNCFIHGEVSTVARGAIVIVTSAARTASPTRDVMAWSDLLDSIASPTRDVKKPIHHSTLRSQSTT